MTKLKLRRLIDDGIIMLSPNQIWLWWCHLNYVSFNARQHNRYPSVFFARKLLHKYLINFVICFALLQFVAHPNCQQLLASIWYEGLPGWRKRNVFTKIVLILGLILLMPFMAVYYLFFPRSRLSNLLRSPFMKFMYHSASFGVFLILLILASTNVSAGDAETQADRKKQRGPAPAPLEILIVLYVTAVFVSEFNHSCII